MSSEIRTRALHKVNPADQTGTPSTEKSRELQKRHARFERKDRAAAALLYFMADRLDWNGHTTGRRS